MSEKTYLQAISDGLRAEMRRDERVFVIGEDVGVYGGAFKVTLGFQEEFGAWRVLDAPLSETAILGGATGAAMMGLRPVAEMQFADFVSCAWDHLVTVAAKQRWRVGTPVPIVLRLPSGGGFSGGPFHSQNPESSFAHIPGLKCVCPSTPEDAKGLLATAIEDPNPVLYFEHKHLYRRLKAEVPEVALESRSCASIEAGVTGLVLTCVGADTEIAGASLPGSTHVGTVMAGPACGTACACCCMARFAPAAPATMEAARNPVISKRFWSSRASCAEGRRRIMV
jgi:pyruvate/2-oxoglutarate/acetoin dehydrogenase E1 component